MLGRMLVKIHKLDNIGIYKQNCIGSYVKRAYRLGKEDDIDLDKLVLMSRKEIIRANREL